MVNTVDSLNSLVLSERLGSDVEWLASSLLFEASYASSFFQPSHEKLVVWVVDFKPADCMSKFESTFREPKPSDEPGWTRAKVQ